MPNYDFEDVNTGELVTHFMSMSELDEFKEKNPHLRRVISAPAIVSGTGSGGVKASGAMQEIFAKAAEAHPNSPLAERYGKKSIKEIKTREVLKKHKVIE